MTRTERAALRALKIASSVNADPVWTATIIKTLKLDKAARRVLKRKYAQFLDGAEKNE